MGAIPAFVVNLPEDGDRLRLITHQLAPTQFDFREAVGFLGRTMPDGACLRLTRDPNSKNNKGALGVMMSHILIWERVARLDEPFAMVLEDDVLLQQPERLQSVVLPPQFDLIFCGDQTATEEPASTTPPTCVPAIQALLAIEQRHVSVGAYGYLLSPAGARKLLALFAEHLYFGHVDVRMMAYCCEIGELNRLGPIGPVTEELRSIRRLIDDRPKLDGFALTFPLVAHIGMTSRRVREDTAGMTREVPEH